VTSIVPTSIPPRDHFGADLAQEPQQHDDSTNVNEKTKSGFCLDRISSHDRPKVAVLLRLFCIVCGKKRKKKE
jgi:hypothetical protein